MVNNIINQSINQSLSLSLYIYIYIYIIYIYTCYGTCDITRRVLYTGYLIAVVQKNQISRISLENILRGCAHAADPYYTGKYGIFGPQTRGNP